MCRAQLDRLRQKRRRHRTDEDWIELNSLPNTIELLQEDIDGVSNDLGGNEFRAMGDAAGK